MKRSAFTYCEENTPSRLDLGMEQYGGPFITEEVEDVKTFLRLLLLLVSLFGYHIASDGFLVAENMQLDGCPSLAVWGTLVSNPGFVSSIVVLISIPTIWLLPKSYRFIPNMLKRIAIGMLMMLWQDLFYTALSSFPFFDDKKPLYNFTSTYSSYDYCLYSRDKLLILGHHFPSESSLPVNNTFLVVDYPSNFQWTGTTVSEHMTVLEFLCAQAPRSLQGLLIGLWYAMFSIRYLIMRSLDYVFTSPEDVFIYQVVRTGLVLLSLVMYACVSRGYQYRIRDWVVNVQWMVEDVIERRMDQEDSYNRRRMAEEEIFLENSSSSLDESDCLRN